MTVRADIAPADSPQVAASDPAASVFVAANAGSGKTKTLVDRVARLLLTGARPEAILCVTYTKAAAAEMQRRLFKELGDWAVMDDAPLSATLRRARRAGPRPRPRPRPLRPRPGDAGRHQDHHHPRLLREAAAALPAGGRRLAGLHGAGGRGRPRCLGPGARGPGAGRARRSRTARSAAPTLLLGRARLPAASARCSPPSRPSAAPSAPMSSQLRRRALRGRHLAPLRLRSRNATPTRSRPKRWRRIRWGQWRRAAEALLAGTAATDQRRGQAMLRVDDSSPFADVWAIFATKDGEPARARGHQAGRPWAAQWLAAEQTAARRGGRTGARRRASPRPASTRSAWRSPTPSSTTAPRTRCGRSTSAT